MGDQLNSHAQRCRACGATLDCTFVDLGVLPLCQTYLRADQLADMEPFYPLHAQVCGGCFLTQLPVYVPPEAIFTEYAYFSSHSDYWLRHVAGLADLAVSRFGLDASSTVVEAASNDGYLLQFFSRRGITVLGVEPAANVAQVANDKGVRTIPRFFGGAIARELVSAGTEADLLLALNVLDHVPDICDFVAAMKMLLKSNGVVITEFPSLAKLIEHSEFDTIYHDRFSYLSFTTVHQIFASCGLAVFDVEELSTHDGSLRVYARRAEVPGDTAAAVPTLLEREAAAGIKNLDYYRAFAEKAKIVKRDLLDALISAKRAGKSIVGYGIPAKGNVLLNYCGIRTDFLDYVVDRSPYKQGKYTPGTHVPILPIETIGRTRPDYLLVLPWNIKEEVMEQMASINDWGGRFIIPVPQVRVY